MTQENQIMIREDYSVADVVNRVKAVDELFRQVMREGEHYGKIPGTPKPTLYKAGAEKILAMFGLASKTERTEIRDLPNGHREYILTVGLYKKDSGNFWGDGSGSCSTMEKKYRYVYSNGEKIEREDIADLYNTILKMAEKRAMVAAVLKATGVSDIFTQDIEDMDFAQAQTQGEYALDNDNAPDKETYNGWKRSMSKDQIKAKHGYWRPRDDGGFDWYAKKEVK